MESRQITTVPTTIVVPTNVDGSFEIPLHIADKLQKGDRFYIESLAYLKDMGCDVDGFDNFNDEFTIEVDYKEYVHVEHADYFDNQNLIYSLIVHIINES